MYYSKYDDPEECEMLRSVLDLERAYAINRRLRNQHADGSVRFAGSSSFQMWLSSVALSTALDELKRVSGDLRLSSILAGRNTAPLLVALVSHGNIDISAKVLSVLQKTTWNYEYGASNVEAIISIIGNLQKEGIVNKLVPNVSRFDESLAEEATAIDNTVSLVCDLIDYHSEFPAQGYQSPIEWMVEQLKKAPEFNSIKKTISFTLLRSLRAYDGYKIHLSEAGGIGVLVQQVASYQLVPPKTREEEEFLKEIFKCLATAMKFCYITRQAFFDAGGVDLIKLILEEGSEA